MTDHDYVLRFDIVRRVSTTWETDLDEMRAIYAAFEALGISTVKSSRIKAYHDAFHSLLDAARNQRHLDLNLATRVLNTMVEFRQLQTILKAATASRHCEMWTPRLCQLISGSEFSTRESNSASARDFQFESFIGAVCELSGYAVHFDEPDIILSDNAEVFGIAAKRPRNRRQIEKNCKKAVRQIRRSGVPGLIALDLSFALQANQCVNTNDLLGAKVLVEEIVNGFIHENNARLRQICREECVLGVLAHLQMPVINFGHQDGPQVATAIRWTVAPFTDPQLDGFLWANEFNRKCEIGLFGPRPLDAIPESISANPDNILNL